jgi:NAD(P)-dependent dehydrogenase (short-subunit alcohol dehydrogenase family)
MDNIGTILVTGASSGIGAHCARALKRDGWRVFATARREKDIETLRNEGIECFYLDYTQSDSIRSCLSAVLSRTGGTLDALFNNGAYAQAGAVEDLPTEALRAQFEANFFGWHDLTRQVVPVMRAQGHGRLVHCSSVLGFLPVQFRGAYAASKYALEGLLLCMRLELHGTGIHLSLIEPGPVVSNIATNGLPWFRKYIDIENSPHRTAYEYQLSRLRSGGSKSYFKPGPEAVYTVLRHALTRHNPRPHYVVTVPAKVGMVLKRFLPASLFYRLLTGRG